MKNTLFYAAACLAIVLSSHAARAEDYFIQGSGQIQIKGPKGGSGVLAYRSKEGYDEKALRKINQIYGGNYDDYLARMSLRFLEVLSNIQAHFNGAPIVIRSGYRSPNANQGLRNQGKLAAQSSMHIEASAMDFYLEGVDTLALKEYATSLPCCGVGYYHGKHIHLDTGPKRWWDEKTSGTEKKEPQENEKIIALTQKDIYGPKEPVAFDFARVSDFPIGVTAKVQLQKLSKDQWADAQTLPLDFSRVFPPAPSASALETDPNRCVALQSRREIKRIGIENPGLAPGRYRVQVKFCDKQWSKMPEQIESNEFEVRK